MPQNKPIVVQPREKPFIPVIVSNNTHAVQPSENLVRMAFASSTADIDTADNQNIKAKRKESVAELMKRLTGIEIELCKHCKIGRLEKIPLPPSLNQSPVPWDTS